MILIDTHTHLYLEQFDTDRREVIQRAIDAGVKTMLLPNIDSTTLEPMNALKELFPKHLKAMTGLHPTSVNQEFEKELQIIEDTLIKGDYCALGETGIDLYWDKTFEKEQMESLRQHIRWADKYNLPVVIHSREALPQIISVLNEKNLPEVRGVFHCYPGDEETALLIIKKGFMIGVGGTITYKKSLVPDVIKRIGAEHIVLETDAPYLPPVPYRGKRNESSYITFVASKIAEITGLDTETVAEITSRNAINLFGLKD